MSASQLTQEKLIQAVIKMRQLQRRYWSSKAQNEMQVDYKRKLMIECKVAEKAVDVLLLELNAVQADLAL